MTNYISAAHRLFITVSLMSLATPVIAAPLYTVIELGIGSSGTGISASGHVTGNISGAGGIHAFLYDGSTTQDLGTPDDADSVGRGINASGQITGDDSIGGNDYAFLYDGASMLDLNDLIASTDPPAGQIMLSSGQGINDAGQIVANGIGPNGEARAFLLSPVVTADIPKPASLALLGAGLLGLACTRHRGRQPILREARNAR